MKARIVHLIVSKIAHILFLLAGFKFIHKTDPFTAYVMLGCFIIKLIANELYLYDIILEVEKEGRDEFERLFKKIKREEDDNV